MQTNSVGLKLVLIPPGEFDMGSTEAEVARLLEEAKSKKLPHWYIGRLPSEAPKHRVKITDPFYIGLCQVTQAEYQRVIGSNSREFKGDPNRPVEMLSWDETSAFCRTLSELPREKSAGVVYRLPTEAEWEYACRAGTTTTWYGTHDEAALMQQARFTANAGQTTHPVGQKAPNAWGLYDMHGNVFECCHDWFGEGYYAVSPKDDSTGPPNGSDRVCRGGSWSNGAGFCRSSSRYGYGPTYRGGDLGFRVARSVSAK